MLKITYYTAIIGSYDNPEVLDSIQADENDRLYYFSDIDLKLSNAASRIPYVRVFKDPIRDARKIKISEFSRFRESDYTVWFDANLKINPKAIRKYLETLDETEKTLKVFSHDVRDCLYDEAQWVFSKNVDTLGTVSRQVNRYQHEGMPRKFGLANTNIVIRDPNSARAIEFSKLWLEEINRGSRRDQLSFDYLRWKLNEPVTTMEGLWYNNALCLREEHEVLKRPTPEASLRSIFEWGRRLIHADNLFGDVLYIDRR